MSKFRIALTILSVASMFVPLKVFADSPGQIVGYSTRDQQTVGATINRCALDDQAGAHLSWTAGDVSNRYVYYNFVDENGTIMFDVGQPVNAVAGGGFPTVVTDANDAAVIAYHNFSDLNLMLAVDAGRGMGIFTTYDPPDNLPAGDITFWPRVAIDNSGNYHIISIAHGMEEITVPMIYSHSENDGQQWVGPNLIDTIAVQAYLVIGSKYDSKVAIVYAKPRQIFDADFYNNDVVYIESPDGVTWDFDNKINITNYTTNDTVRCFNSLDAVYDPQGDLHIVWTTPFYDEISREATSDSCLLWHWSEATGAAIITEGLNHSVPGAWDLSISSCNISVNDAGELYVTYSRFDDLDMSSGGFSNGDIFYTFSIDDGVFWFPDENLTNSHSDGCQPGNCDNDFQLSTAEFVNNALHLFYINDKDAGMSSGGEGEETNNPQMYLRHTISVGVDDGGNKYVPGRFYLSPAYPNPFNGFTNLGYEIVREGPVRIDLFNLRGQVVKNLVNELKPTGHHLVNLNAEGLASGIYYARLTSGGEAFTRKLTLLK